MIFKQFYFGCLAHASYVIGDETAREAAVIDPQRDVDHYLAFAAAHQLRIRHVLLSHLHADFIARRIELRDRVGAQIYLGYGARAEYPFVALAHGDRIAFGQVSLQTVTTPGPRPPDPPALLTTARQTSLRRLAVDVA
jgi:glyoxylase-like metal-dependent hydrolase (beta-lactamase superfamily II)